MNDVIAWIIAGAVIAGLTSTGAANSILSMLDLSDNLKRTAGWAASVRGLPAGITAACFFILAYVFGGLAYRYDLVPTYRFIEPVARDVMAVATDWLVIFGILLTLLPTLIELATAGLVQRDIRVLQYLVYFFIGFDLITDYKEAVALVEVWQAQNLFATLPDAVARAAMVLAKIGWTFAASFAFEFLCIIFAVGGLLLAANAGNSSGSGGGRP